MGSRGLVLVGQGVALVRAFKELHVGMVSTLKPYEPLSCIKGFSHIISNIIWYSYVGLSLQFKNNNNNNILKV
jgi:hypothetical protein